MCIGGTARRLWPPAAAAAFLFSSLSSTSPSYSGRCVSCYVTLSVGCLACAQPLTRLRHSDDKRSKGRAISPHLCFYFLSWFPCRLCPSAALMDRLKSACLPLIPTHQSKQSWGKKSSICFLFTPWLHQTLIKKCLKTKILHTSHSRKPRCTERDPHIFLVIL